MVASNSIVEGWDNIAGTRDFAFIEFASTNSEVLHQQFSSLGFVPIKKHPLLDITVYRQGNITFIINGEQAGFAADFAEQHGPSACALGFKVENKEQALVTLLDKGATLFEEEGHLDIDAPAIVGIGGSALYLVEDDSIYDHFQPLSNADTSGVGLTYLDHVTHNVFQGNMDTWAGFYEKLFNFREIRYFDIEGKLTGLKSRAMTSPCGKIRIPINESSDDKSQIEEYLNEYKGEGIQHIALGTDDIYKTVTELREHGIDFLTVPDTYYQEVDNRISGHKEDLPALQQRRILIDGAPTEGQGLLLQIFTQNMLGPIFFEIIQRKGNEGFGEGNFQALFEAIERDQVARGVLASEEKSS